MEEEQIQGKVLLLGGEFLSLGLIQTLAQVGDAALQAESLIEASPYPRTRLIYGLASIRLQRGTKA
jgi:hypothetical protein